MRNTWRDDTTNQISERWLMSERGRVTANKLNLRAAPVNGAVLKSLERGTEVEILSEADGWLGVKAGDDEGYVSADYVEQEAVQKGTVTASKLNIRSEPSTDGAVLGSFARDAELDVLDTREGWLHVRFGDGEGYVSGDHVAMRQATRTGRITASSLNLRDAPNGERIGSLAEGAEVVILDENDGWVEVDANGESGWVSAEYVTEGDEDPPEEEDPAAGVPDGFRIEGRDVFGPEGPRFARTFKLGVFSSGDTSIVDYVSANRGAFDLSESKLNVMQAVSTNEGNLDAINTWDNAFLTFGCFQWTVGTGDGAGELASVIDRLRQADADAFEALFGQYGLGVADISAPDSEPPRGFFTLDGDVLRSPAQKEQMRSIVWAYRFKQAGQNDTMRGVQIAHAAERVDLFYRSDRKSIRDKHVADYVTSQYGVALLLDQHVNRPGHVPRTLAQAVDQFIDARGGADDPENWGDGDEAKLLEIYVTLRNETSMTDAQGRADRTKAAVESGLASDARGSYQA